MGLKNFIKNIVRECLNEQQSSEDIRKYTGNTFDVQESTAEETVGKQKDSWGSGQIFRERIENAGDILRELSSRGHKPDYGYIEEKIKKITDWLNKDFTEIPDEIETIEDFNKTYLRWSTAIDSREFVVKFYPEILQQTINEYEAIPVYSNETKIAKELVLNLLYGNKNKLLISLRKMKNICEQIKTKGFITFTSL
jgi:hypothetical protein